MSRGRKRKKEIILTSNIDETSEEKVYIDFPIKSISEKSLIWESYNQQTEEKDIYSYPLSKESAIKYWEKEVNNTTHNNNAKSTLSRIKKGSYFRDQERHVYDKHPKNIELINTLVYTASSLCTIKKASKRTGSHYAAAITSIVNYLLYSFKDINSINDIDEHKQGIIYNELCSHDSNFFNKSSSSIAKSILVHALQNNKISCVQLERKLRNSSHSGAKTRLDYPQEVALQLLHIAVTEISSIIYKREEYLSWKRSYNNKAFDSLENIAKAYTTIPSNFLYKNTAARKSSIIRYQLSYDKLCLNLYGFKLSTLSNKKIAELAQKGQNIDDLENPKIMSWFIDDILANYPFDINKEGSTSLSDTPMSKYTRWNISQPLRSFLTDRNKTRQKDFNKVFNDIMSRIHPTANEILPFVLFWILQTGCNPEAIINMKRKEKYNKGIYDIGEISPLGNTPVIKSFKNRGTKNWYWFVLNKNEKGGLYDYFTFLKSYLSQLWNKQDCQDPNNKWPFWIYCGTSPLDKINILSRANLQYRLTIYIKNKNILLPNGDVMDNLELSRLRNTFITTADLNGLSIDEIQEWIKHDIFDTRFKYYSNSPDQRSRNFRAINGIQEDIIENARTFQGETSKDSYQKDLLTNKVDPTYLSGCSNKTNPAYKGAKKIPETHICIDWDMCLFCPNARVFREHLPRICARILQYESFKKKMTSDEWENNFGLKKIVAKDALKKWISDGGQDKDIENAWFLANSGKIILPPIFPTGHLNVKGGNDAA